MRSGVQIHPTAVIDEPCTIGEGTKIWHFCHIMTGAQIGRNCVLGQNVMVASKAKLGDNVKVQNNVSVFDGVVLESGVFCAPSVVFTNVKRPRAEVSRREEYEQTLVRRGATIGANATVLCGNEIGECAFVGGGSVVTSDVPPHAIVVGNPARLAGWACACGERLELPGQALPPAVARGATCKRCNKRWMLSLRCLVPAKEKLLK